MDETKKEVVKIDELAYYSSNAAENYAVAEKKPSFLQENFKVLRGGFLEGINLLNILTDQVDYVVNTGKAHSMVAYNQLTEEENLPARIGVITGAGAFGLAIGTLRGRLPKRIFYTLIGSGGATAFCYPEQASEIGNTCYEEGRKNLLIAQKFITGVEGSVETPSILTKMSSSTDMNLIAQTIKITFNFLNGLATGIYQVIDETIKELNGDKKDGGGNVEDISGGEINQQKSLLDAPTVSVLDNK